MMNLGHLMALVLAILLATRVHGDDSCCVDVNIEPDYEAALKENTFLMQSGGVDTLTLPDTREVLVGVGYVALKPGATPADINQARRVAEAKATSTVSEFLRTDISSVSTLIKTTNTQTETNDEGLQQRSQRVEKFLSTKIHQRSHMTARITRIGQWRSADGLQAYVAVVVTPLDKSP